MRKKNYICTENSSVQITDKLSKIQDYTVHFILVYCSHLSNRARKGKYSVRLYRVTKFEVNWSSIDVADKN